jgi:outer membrane biosynthesis protein TonB
VRYAAAIRQPTGGVGAGLIGSVAVHAGVVAFLWVVVQPPAPSPPSYAVELVAAPAPKPEQKPAPETVTRPPAEQPAPTKPAPKPLPKTAPTPPPKPAETEQKTEPNPRTTAQQAPLPGEKPSTGSDAVTVSTPGLAFAFPEYLRNIVQEVYRRWDRPMGSSLKAEVSFLILRDGTVREIRVTSGSGNFSFDLAAQGAIEAAGAAKAFGPLPDGYEADVLPVSFYFTPRPQ